MAKRYLSELTRPKGEMVRSSDGRRRGGCDGALWSIGIAENEEYEGKRGSFSWLVRSSSTHEEGRRIHERSRGRTNVVTGGSNGVMEQVLYVGLLHIPR
ncbi:hypothetical protein Lser_V15G22645 [Lactuca serriola]